MGSDLRLFKIVAKLIIPEHHLSKRIHLDCKMTPLPHNSILQSHYEQQVCHQIQKGCSQHFHRHRPIRLHFHHLDFSFLHQLQVHPIPHQVNQNLQLQPLCPNHLHYPKVVLPKQARSPILHHLHHCRYYYPKT